MSPKIKSHKAITIYLAVLDGLKEDQLNDATKQVNFIRELSCIEELTLNAFLEKLQEHLSDLTLFARACCCDQMKDFLSSSSSATPSPENQSNLEAAPAGFNIFETPGGQHAPAANNAVQSHEPIFAPGGNVSPTAAEALENLSEVNTDVDDAIAGMDLGFDANGAEEPILPPAADDGAPNAQPSPLLFNARDFLVKKIAEYNANPDGWEWFKPEGHYSFILRNYLVVVDENGQLLNDPAHGGWDPNQEIYLQSKVNQDYACYDRERPMLNDQHLALYPNAPFFRAFATPATAAADGATDNGAGPSTEIALKDCSYPVYTVENALDTTNMQLRLMVMVVRSDWANRTKNPGQAGETGGAWPQTLHGLQGQLVYLKIRPSNKSCYYYNKNYKAASNWPTPPPRDAAAEEEEHRQKRRRTVPARFVVDQASNYSQKEASIRDVLPLTTPNCFPRWSRQIINEQSVGDRFSDIFALFRNAGVAQLDLLACYKQEGSNKRVWIKIECDENNGHQDKNSEEEMKCAFKLAETRSQISPTDLIVYLRINPDVCEDFDGFLEVSDYETQIENMVEHICMQAAGIDSFIGTSELPIYYLFFPDGHRYTDFPEGHQIPRSCVEGEYSDLVEYRLSVIRDGKLRKVVWDDWN
jgi:hypothetical protein